MQTSAQGPQAPRTWRISADKLTLALVARKARPQTRWAAMSEHVVTAACKTQQPGGGYFIRSGSQLTPMHRGDLLSCVERAARHSRHECRRTWGVGVHRLRTEVRSTYILPAAGLDAAVPQQRQQGPGRSAHGGGVGQQHLAKLVGAALLGGVLVGLGGLQQPACAAQPPQLHAQPVQQVGIQGVWGALAPQAFGHVAHHRTQLGQHGVDGLVALHVQAQPIASPEGQQGQASSDAQLPVGKAQEVEHFWHIVIFWCVVGLVLGYLTGRE